QGTIIKGVTGLPPGSVSALTVQRNAQIYALGDSCCPIIFTAQTDNVNDPTDLGRSDRGLWGSLIILGNAPINGTVTPPEICATNFVEGLTPSPKTQYGGCNAFDNSGIVQWVQLKHGGSIIGAANEINGLTMGGVGSGTTIDHIEVFANLDDGYEWFGGTVNCRYLVSAFNDDDAFDWDQGYSGNLQFLFAIYDSTNGDRAFEIDGDDGNADTQPYSRPTVYNVTAFGRGEVLAAAPSNQNAAIHAKENTGGHFRNAIFYEWPRNGVFIEDQSGPSFSLAPLPDCTILGGQIDAEYNSRCATAAFTNPNWVGGYSNVNPAYAVANFDIFGTIWCAINSAAVTPSLVASAQTFTEQRLFTDYPAAGGAIAGVPGGSWDNVIDDPMFAGNNRARSRFASQNALDPRPAAGSPAFSIGLKDAPSENSWFASAPYAGAFDASNNWLLCWTALWQADYLNEGPAAITGICGDADCTGIITISDAVYLINYIFAGGPAPCTPTAGDADGTGIITISDAVYLINYIFAGGPAPACPACS
ncbi:MAG: dockerin type I repeat-containing protein, partial [Candidatus Zixiibacteriota bacterium]